MNFYQKIDNAIETCKQHLNQLDPTDLKNKEVETYLVAGLVVLIISEYEEHLEHIFSRKADLCGDRHASNYIKSVLSQKFRSPDLSKISETLSRFDMIYKSAFESNILNSPEHAAWDSLMKARHAVVHKKGNLNLTFLELCRNYILTKSVISNIENMLSVAS